MKYDELKDYIAQQTAGRYELYAVSEDSAIYSDWVPGYYVHIKRISDEKIFLDHNPNMFAAAAFAIHKGEKS